MSEERRSYRYDRVLIESDRVLTPQFADAVVFLSGAQIEMLRNMTPYLRKLDSYVSSHHLGYYMTPNVEDYDDILAIVSDLEETLMGNPNVIWGYKDVYGEGKYHSNLPAGTGSLYWTTVAEGEVLRVLGASFYVNSATCTQVRFFARIDGSHTPFDAVLTPVSTQLYTFRCDIVLKEGDFAYMTVYGATLGDTLNIAAWGYQMDTPA